MSIWRDKDLRLTVASLAASALCVWLVGRHPGETGAAMGAAVPGPTRRPPVVQASEATAPPPTSRERSGEVVWASPAPPEPRRHAYRLKVQSRTAPREDAILTDREIVRAVRTPIRACLAVSRTAMPLEGTMVLALAIGRDGALHGVRDIGGSLTDDDASSCILKRVHFVSFASPESSTVVAEIRIDIQEDASRR